MSFIRCMICPTTRKPPVSHFRCLLSLYCICEYNSSCAVQIFFMILFDFREFVKANFDLPLLSIFFYLFLSIKQTGSFAIQNFLFDFYFSKKSRTFSPKDFFSSSAALCAVEFAAPAEASP